MPLALLLGFTTTGSFPVQKLKLECPKGTEYRKRVPEELAKKPNFSQEEEYCVMRKSNGALVKEGPYVIWGPNGERQLEGQYANDKKVGKWTRSTPSQTVEETWSNGELVGTTVLSQPSSLVIDFGACIPHEFSIPAALGSTAYQLLGKKKGFCELRYSIEIERGQGPQIFCSVPTEMKKVVIHNTQTGLNFSSIETFCKK